MMKRKPCATIQFNQISQHSSNMRTIKLTVCYDGSNYFGFQRQAKEITVQQILEEKLARVCGEPVTVTGSGRTDAGVHARSQVVSFTTDGTIPTANLPRALNSILPERIRVPHPVYAGAGSVYAQLCVADERTTGHGENERSGCHAYGHP